MSEYIIKRRSSINARRGYQMLTGSMTEGISYSWTWCYNKEIALKRKIMKFTRLYEANAWVDYLKRQEENPIKRYYYKIEVVL